MGWTIALISHVIIVFPGNSGAPLSADICLMIGVLSAHSVGVVWPVCYAYTDWCRVNSNYAISVGNDNDDDGQYHMNRGSSQGSANTQVNDNLQACVTADPSAQQHALPMAGRSWRAFRRMLADEASFNSVCNHPILSIMDC
jgi:hypothetical protein